MRHHFRLAAFEQREQLLDGAGLLMARRGLRREGGVGINIPRARPHFFAKRHKKGPRTWRRFYSIG